MTGLVGTGVWSAALAAAGPDRLAEAAPVLEELGYTSLWLPALGPDIFDAVDAAMGATQQLVVATGVLNVWVHPAADTASHVAALTDAHGDRFLLGVGVSHAPLVERVAPGTRYERPLATMAAYLDELDAASTPVPPARRIVAALGPRMLDLAGSRAGGAHPYNVTPEHTVMARQAVGPQALLVPEQAVALTGDPAEARRIGRAFLSTSLHLPNYANNLRRLGFSDLDLEGGGSDRLVDALVAWGDPPAIARRLQAHRDAGADSVCIQVLHDAPMGGMVVDPLDVCRQLAEAVV